MNEKKKLGRGLSALFSEANLDGDNFDTTDEIKNQIVEIALVEIKANKDQPRSIFDAEKLNELAQSIKNYGLIEPLIVNKKEDDLYELIAGERRWRAAKIAGLERVPCVIKGDATNKILELMLIENIQREDLTPLEEARSYEVIMQRKDLTHEALAEAIGKSRTHVTNLLRVLRLPNEIKAQINEKRLSIGHAKMLVGLEEDQMRGLVIEIIEKDLSVREVERKVKLLHTGVQDRGVIADDGIEKIVSPLKSTQETHFKNIESVLRETLQTKVSIRPKKKGGVIEIEYYDDKNLENIINRIY